MRLLNAILSTLVIILTLAPSTATAKVFAHGVNEGPKRIVVPTLANDPDAPDPTETGDGTPDMGDPNTGIGSDTPGGPAGIDDDLDGPATCLADATGDDFVNVLDLVAVFEAWGDCVGDCPADVNGDQVVDVMDLIEVIAAWGLCTD